jgi:histidyl-tRNA synthetase
MLDVLPEDRLYWDMIIDKAIDLAGRYGFQRINVPIIEKDELFSRGVGEASDFFVKKEMYTITEEDGNRITLRPEFTAGIVRAYLQNGMVNWPQPVKIYSIGPVFRRERPQAGRFREHSQFNPEILGTWDPAADLEIMMLARNLHRELGYKNLTFQLNSTGCPVCKPKYVDELKKYLSAHQQILSDVDKERLKRNPLRILDSKDESIDELIADAPHIVDFLCDDCATHFADLRQYLDELNQPYAINFRLVRGIDYYTKTVFELWDKTIGAQASLCGGGRYDGLAEAIGGPQVPGVGVGFGIERIAIGLKKQDIKASTELMPSVLLIHFGGGTKTEALRLTYALRENGIASRIAFARRPRSMRSQMREANRHQAAFVIIVGEDEIAKGEVAIRQMESGEQSSVQSNKAVSWISEKLNAS